MKNVLMKRYLVVIIIFAAYIFWEMFIFVKGKIRHQLAMEVIRNNKKG